MDGPPNNDFCSICHANFYIPCQANCSHWFCGNCILQIWNHGSALRPCKCPLCRREITLLVPSEVSSRQRCNPEVAEVYRGQKDITVFLVNIQMVLCRILICFLYVAALYRSVLVLRHGGS